MQWACLAKAATSQMLALASTRRVDSLWEHDRMTARSFGLTNLRSPYLALHPQATDAGGDHY